MRNVRRSTPRTGKCVGMLSNSMSILILMTTGSMAAEPVDLVNMYIGTDGHSRTEYGGTMPFIEPPFAMTSWTPQTRQNRISVTSYAYKDSAITGFIGTHQPAIWMGDFGYVTLMPEVDTIRTAPEARQLPFRHSDETATPYYYSVTMDAGLSRNLKTEITATEHCAILQFTYPKNACSSIVVETTRPKVAGYAALDEKAQEISGYNPDRMDAHLSSIKLPNFKGYFVIRINKAFSAFGTYQGGNIHAGGNAINGDSAGAYVQFGTNQNEVVQAKVGTSFISVDQARDNLNKEIPAWDFAGIKERLRANWNQKLALFSLHGGTNDQIVQFYTALYHCLLYPRLFSEGGRYYSAFDDRIHDGVSYTSYSLWDTFRAENSLITLVCPERFDGMVQALLQDYQEGGWMPKWPNPSYTSIMVGTHADSIVAEAINKGFRGFDYNLAYNATYQDAMTPPNNDRTKRWGDRTGAEPYAAREGLTYYKALGYVPADKTNRSTSCTLEGAYDDWCVAQVAKAAGKMDVYKMLYERAKNYKNVFNPRIGWMEGRNSDGTWVDGPDSFTEGGQRQNTFTVFQDVPGLIKLMGGPAAFINALDHSSPDLSNEPGEHFPYLYDYAGLPSKAQSMVRKGMLASGYANTPEGLPGNDDCGQISAWWLFGAMGFYPVNPASGVYMIGTPLFDQMTFNIPNGKIFTITAVNNFPANVYIQSATLNGNPLDVPFITWAQIQAGGELSFVLGSTPSKWAADWVGNPL